MKREDIVRLTLKLLGLYALVRASLTIPTLIYHWISLRAAVEAGVPTTYFKAAFPSSAALAVMYLAGGVALLAYAKRIGGWLTRNDHAAAVPEARGSLISVSGFRFCVRLLGIYAFFLAAPKLARIFHLHSSEPFSAIHISWNWPELTTAALQVAFGLYLLRGGKWLVRFAWGAEEKAQRSAQS